MNADEKDKMIDQILANHYTAMAAEQCQCTQKKGQL
jgi:hypothetical protein